MRRRYLEFSIRQDLNEKMVFIGGPRQVGKTTLALQVAGLSDKDHPAYRNWDDARTKSLLIKGELPDGNRLIVFDEIHKYARWRNYLKGLYDTRFPKTNFLVTGSARLDYYRKGGDSLVGRYHYFRLHPFSFPELGTAVNRDDLRQLLRLGGFPEPFLKGDETYWRRWQRERLSRVIYDDLRDLEHVREVSLIELLLDALPERVGSPLSIKNLRDQLDVAHDTVERWISILENLYVVFRIAPFGAPKIKAVKKEQKLYFWDWSQCADEGSRFENMVACHLLKHCHFIEDTTGHRMELRYLRDVEKREVDFVVLKDRVPEFAVECKSGERAVSPAIHYFRQRVRIPSFFQVHLGQKDYSPKEAANVRVLPFAVFCKQAGIV